MNGLLRSGGVLLILGTLVSTGPSWSEMKPKPPAPRTRIGLVNLSHVVKNYAKYERFQTEIKEIIERYQKRDKDLRESSDRLNKQLEDISLSEEEREEIEKKVKKLSRNIEENNEEAKKVLSKKSDAQMVVLYAEVEKAAERYAKAHDLDLVMHYNDAVDEAERNGAANVARKFKDGACLPLYVGPGIAISDAVIEILNKELGDISESSSTTR
jgi:Skp family chaperone for outer membrane proteins